LASTARLVLPIAETLRVLGYQRAAVAQRRMDEVSFMRQHWSLN
jgi:anthranilate phosphoribosyltransferase